MCFIASFWEVYVWVLYYREKISVKEGDRALWGMDCCIK